MAHMSSNVESPRWNYGDRSQLTNWILDSGATCHTTSEISDCLPGSLVETDKCIEVSDGHFVTAKQTWQVQIDILDENGKHFIDMLYNLLLSPDLCYWLLKSITVINLGHKWPFHKGFCTFFFSDDNHKAMTLTHSAQIKHVPLVKM